MDTMKARLRSLWQRRKQHPMATIGIIVAGILGIALIVVIVLGYQFNWDWTGFNGHIGPNVQQYQPAKTLWDWLNLLGVLAIPIVVVVGAAWFTAQQAKVSDAENTDSQRETALQAYIEKMSELLLVHHLRGAKEDEEVRTIARVHTLTVLPRLDGKRKRSLLLFLYEASLINKDKYIIDLRGADLRGADLTEVNLTEANLSRAILNSANLSRATLTGAYLYTTELREANLSRAILNGANLSFAKLSKANLFKANLSRAILSETSLDNADLRNADLSKAGLYQTNLTGANLKGAIGITIEELEKQAKTLEGAIMP